MINKISWAEVLTLYFVSWPDPPKGFPGEQVKSVDAGESVTFDLYATGSPSPNITWYRSGTRVSGSQYDIKKVGANSSQLTINSASSADHGYFDCQVTSSGLKPAAVRFFLGVLKCRLNFTLFLLLWGDLKCDAHWLALVSNSTVDHNYVSEISVSQIKFELKCTALTTHHLAWTAIWLS